MDIYDFHAENTPDKPALVFEDRRLSWPDLALRTRKAANALIGLDAGSIQRLATFAHNSDELIVASAGARSGGSVVVPINWHSAASELNYILKDSESTVLFTDDEHFELALEALPDTQVRDVVLFGESKSTTRPDVRIHNWRSLLRDAPQDPPRRQTSFFGSYMMYTSGTTGRPKGAFQSTPPDAEVGLNYSEAFGLGWEDVHLVAGPLYHSAPSAFCGMELAMGATIVVMKKFDPIEALETIERERVTTTFMAPILLSRLVSVPRDIRDRYDTSSLRSLIIAGASCPANLKARAQECFGKVLYEFYGSTETKAVFYIKPEDQLRKPGSCGTPFPGVEAKLVKEDGSRPAAKETGEVWVRRNSSTFDGYYGDPEKTAQTIRGDWIRTGDVAYQDEEDFYYIVDRVDDMIISGGVNIYPAEIEAALNEHPAVGDSAVYGIPDDEWGERVHAVVQPRGEGVPDSEQLSAFLRERLAGYKIPRSWDFSGDILRTDDGKLRKRLLRQRLQDEKSSSDGRY